MMDDEVNGSRSPGQSQRIGRRDGEDAMVPRDVTARTGIPL